MPGVFMSTRNWVRPWRRFSLVDGGVRKIAIMERAICADEVQILVPLISQPPSVLVALVFAANRSEPEFGSLMPMAKQTSPRQMRGRMSILMLSGAYFKRTGPLWRSATKKRRVGALATRLSPGTTDTAGS